MAKIRNSVVAFVGFDFKGKHFNPSVIVDLDYFFNRKRDVEDLYVDLAHEAGIGLYSYELEVMMCDEIEFRDPTGIAEGLVENGRIDWDRLEKAWQENTGLKEMAGIANKYFNVENIDDHPRLVAALAEAYQLGIARAPKTVPLSSGLSEGFYG